MTIANHRLTTTCTLLASFVLCTSVSAGSDQEATAQAQHEHMSGGSAVANMKLDDGKQWATDSPLRFGMAAIRKSFDADHPAIHAGQETDAQYEALAGNIEVQVNDIVRNCHLQPAADANLHFVIADLLQGVNLMRGTNPERSRHDGAALVHGALIAYGQYFEDPGWGH
jgi:hypothetical protein